MSNEKESAAPVEEDLPEQLRIRREKRAGLIAVSYTHQTLPTIYSV